MPVDGIIDEELSDLTEDWKHFETQLLLEKGYEEDDIIKFFSYMRQFISGRNISLAIVKFCRKNPSFLAHIADMEMTFMERRLELKHWSFVNYKKYLETKLEEEQKPEEIEHFKETLKDVDIALEQLNPETAEVYKNVGKREIVSLWHLVTPKIDLDDEEIVHHSVKELYDGNILPVTGFGNIFGDGNNIDNVVFIDTNLIL